MTAVPSSNPSSRAGRHLRYDALDGRARRRATAHATSQIMRWRNCVARIGFRCMPTCGGTDTAKADAEDLVQAFFARFLAKNYLEGLSEGARTLSGLPAGGVEKFSQQRLEEIATAQARRGETPLSLDWKNSGYEVSSRRHPRAESDQAYDREWALALLAKVIAHLQAECARTAKRGCSSS